MPEIFETRVRLENGVPVLDLEGEVNAGAERALDAAYQEATRHAPTSLILNFADVTYINSTGIALIVSLLARARTNRQQVLVYGLTEHYRHIFEITRLADFMSLHEDEAGAVAEAAASTA